MDELLQQFVVMIQNFVSSENIFVSIFFGVFSIILESIMPILPLAVFIAINIISFGNLIGFIISWVATIIGCSISFYISRKCSKFVENKLNKKSKILDIVNRIDSLKFSNLFLILAMPFTPAFSVNIAAGISNMKFEKYLLALFFSKIFIIYFWGYVGSTVIESITNIEVIIKMIIIIIVLFIASKIITKKFNL